MDSNGTRFLLLNSAADFGERSADCGWDAALGAFTLTRRDAPRLPALPAAAARAALQASGPLVLDGHGQYGRLSDDRRQFEFALKWPARPVDWQPVLAELAGDSAPDMAALALDPVDAPAAGDGSVVARLKEVVPADPTADAAGVERLAKALADAINADVLAQYQQALRDEIGVKINAQVFERLFQ